MNPSADDTGPVIPTWDLSDRLRKVRRDVLGADQNEFAELLGVSPQAIGSWETGRTHPREIVALARRIEELSRVPATWFLGLDDAPAAPATAPSPGRRAGARSRRDSPPGERAGARAGARRSYRNNPGCSASAGQASARRYQSRGRYHRCTRPTGGSDERALTCDRVDTDRMRGVSTTPHSRTLHTYLTRGVIPV